MKHLLPILALSTALALSGCATSVGVDNPDNSTASYAGGALTTTYKSDVTAVFGATKRALDSMRDLNVLGRVGETEDRSAEGELAGVTVFARATGDIRITVTIAKAVDAATGGEVTEVSIRWGYLGNCQQSQQLVHRITQNLAR